MRTNSLWLALPLAATLVISGCASTPKPDPGLAEARTELDTLNASPSVKNHAPNALLDAEQSLKRAERAHKEGKTADRDHHLYLARREMDIARTMDKLASTEKETKTLAAERDRLALAGRESALAKKGEELAASKEQLEQSQAHARELESELAAMEAKQTERGAVLTLKDLLFTTDGSTIAPGATPTLDKVVGFLNKNPEQRIVIEGHTDGMGPSDYNKRLSEERANAVKQEIVTRGIDPGRVAAKGYGESRPVASNATSGGRQLNRRVEIVFPNVEG